MAVQEMSSSLPSARDLTIAEVNFFQEHGWVKLDQLISEEGAASLVEHVQALMGRDAANAVHPDTPEGDGKSYQAYSHYFAPLSIDVMTGASTEDFVFAFSHSPEIGRVGARLAGQPVRFFTDQAMVKLPEGTSETGTAPTTWHIDVGAGGTSPFEPSHGQMQLWIALRPVPPERGSMRFVSPRDQSEEVWEIARRLADDPVASYPMLESMGVLSPPLDLKAGDATVHSSATLHSAPANTTDEPRWNMIVSMFPADRRYSGIPAWPCRDVPGMVKGELFPEPRFPVLT